MILIRLREDKNELQRGIVHIANDPHPDNLERDEYGERRSTQVSYWIRCYGPSAKGAWVKSKRGHATCFWCIASKLYGPLNLPRSR